MEKLLEVVTSNSYLYGLATGLLTKFIPLIKDIDWLRAKFRMYSRPEILRICVEKNASFSSELEKLRTPEQTYGEAIIIDIARKDEYFNSVNPAEHKGKSWFKGAIKDLRIDGLELIVRRGCTVMRDVDISGEWEDDDGSCPYPRALSWEVPLIPFENIVEVAWKGNPGARYPHFFCHFSEDGSKPYRHTRYYGSAHFDTKFLFELAGYYPGKRASWLTRAVRQQTPFPC